LIKLILAPLTFFLQRNKSKSISIKKAPMPWKTSTGALNTTMDRTTAITISNNSTVEVDVEKGL